MVVGLPTIVFMPSGNIIPDRIAQALRSFPPFSMMPEEQVVELARDARVKALVVGDVVWSQGDAPSDELMFLQRGRIEYYWAKEGGSELVDVRDVGDLLGLTPLMEGAPYRVSAHVAEDSLVYILPGERFRQMLEESDSARYYVRRHLFWATRVGGKMPFSEEARLEEKRTILQAHLDGAQVVRPRNIERLLTCLPSDSIRKASALMVSKRVPSILVVDEFRRPLGMVTSVNLVKQVIVNEESADGPVSDIMASPVYTVAPQTSATAAILLMLRERVGQICVTEDGTPDSPALDVCTHKDLLAQSGHHPAGLLREIRFARSSARLRELCDEIERIAQSYLESGISAIFLGQMCAELYDELVERLIAMAVETLDEGRFKIPNVPWTWIAVGSDGRREQILRTDMDNAFVFRSSGSEEADEAHRGAFLRLNSRVVELLVECGFSRCQGGVMASNPKWCRSDREWSEELRQIDGIDGERLLRAGILYDMRRVTGDKAMFETLRNLIFSTVAAARPLMARMAESVVATPPPLNFFGKYLVEKKGANAGEFDIKARVLSPLRDATRVLSLHYKLTKHYSTGGRLEELGQRVTELKEMASLAYQAYDFIMRLRTLNGLQRDDSGRYIDPSSLSKLERAQLSNAFDVVRMAQNTLRVEYHLETRSR